MPATVFADDSADDDLHEGAYAGREPCLQRDGILGHRVCPRYGEWALDWPAVTLTFGVNMRHLPQGASPPRAEPGAARTTPSQTPPTQTTSSELDDGVGSNLALYEQVAIAPNPFSFFAFEVEFAPTRQEHLAPGERAFSAATQLVAGLRGGGKALRVGAEIAGGIRCVDAQGEEDEGVLEVRARADLWLTPWLTFGAVIGTSIIEKDDWLTGLSLGLHSNAFGGF